MVKEQTRPPPGGADADASKARPGPAMKVISSGRTTTDKPRGPRGRFTVLHNPQCSKSRKVLARLVDLGLDPIVIDYLNEPPSALQLAEIARKAGLHPREMLRTKEPAFAALARPLDDFSAAAAIAAMVEHPILIERPIVVRGARALIARPPERVDELLGPPARVIPIARLRRPRAKKADA